MILKRLKKLLKKLLRVTNHDEHIKKLYDQKEYLEAYSEHTDFRVDHDSHLAVGGMWEEIGELQFDFLVKNGLQPHHRMLDIGCGTLRGGRYFIRYLNAGNYSGIDISSKGIEYGKQLVQEEGLSDKQPQLLVNKNKDLMFKEFNGDIFDYLLAQSVFTHLMPEHIEDCFQHIGIIMNSNSVFFFTFNSSLEFKRKGLKDFCYPFSFFESLADRYGFHLKDCSDEYQHPRGQYMSMLSKRT